MRPIVLYGLSAGGMLAYHVAAKAPRDTVRGIIGMHFWTSGCVRWLTARPMIC
ncbi:Uncharacterised protein [Mycobacteroides abscessus]|nr:Uncharacterised protein [Mycobacteroides abscessus]